MCLCYDLQNVEGGASLESPNSLTLASLFHESIKVAFLSLPGTPSAWAPPADLLLPTPPNPSHLTVSLPSPWAARSTCLRRMAGREGKPLLIGGANREFRERKLEGTPNPQRRR